MRNAWAGNPKGGGQENESRRSGTERDIRCRSRGWRENPRPPPRQPRRRAAHGHARQRLCRRRLSAVLAAADAALDRKSTRLNSSHLGISYAVFCLKKKKKKYTTQQ